MQTRLLAIILLILLAINPMTQAEDANKSGVTPQVISLPTGPGSIEGLGEAFKPQLNNGSSVYQVKIRVPEAVQGLAPNLALRYDSGFGDGPLGIGWQFSSPSVKRKIDRGLPRYIDTNDGIDNDHDGWTDEADEIDTLISPDGADLVEDGTGHYRNRVEGSFTRYKKNGSGWEAQFKNGARAYYGIGPTARMTDPTHTKVYQWLLEKQVDPNGNTIDYYYTALPGSDNQVYLSEIRWGAGSSPWTHYYLAAFSYETKPDWQLDYRAGFPIKTAHRLKTISVGVHGAAPPHAIVTDLNNDGQSEALVRKYELSYSQDSLNHSKLQQVTLYGADGVNYLPPIRFSYTEFPLNESESAAGKIIHSENTPAVVMDNATVDLVDLNSDGLPDILRTTGINQTITINRGHDADQLFAPLQWEVTQGVNSSDGQAHAVNLSDPQVHLADMNGDGLADLVQTALFGAIYFYPNLGNNGWGDKTQMFTQANTPPAPFSNKDIVTTDLDFDKRIDIVKSLPNGYQVWFNQGNQEYSNMVLVPGASWQGQTLLFSDPRVKQADLNGDRLQDVVKITPTLVVVAANQGYGNYADAVEIPIPDLILTNDQANRAQLKDINGDGLSDLVIERAFANELWYWLNKGRHEFTNRQIITDLPSIYNQNAVTRWADMNGNGSVDLVYADSSAGYRLQVIDFALLAGISAPPNLLKTIDNGLGVKTEISYRNSTQYYQQARDTGTPWTSTMPINVTVVAKEEVSTGLDLDTTAGLDLYVKEYAYRNPFYDPFDKSFRGFAKAIMVETGDTTAPDQISEIEMFTGGPDGVDNDKDGTIDEVAADHRREEYPLAGKVKSLTIKDNNQTTYSRKDSAWQIKTLFTNANGIDSHYATLKEEINLIYEGLATPTTLKTSYVIDTYGNILEETNQGALSIAGDEVVTTNTFINNTDLWLIGFPKTTTVKNGSNQIASQVRLYYDGADYSGLALGSIATGNLTRKQAWVSDTTWLDAERFAYDAYGNRTGLMNGRGFIRSIAYDTDFHQFPISESIEVGNGKPELSVSALFIPGFGKLQEYHDFNDYTSRFIYDSFGRLTKIVRPGDTETLPTEAYSYHLADPSRSLIYQYDSQGALSLLKGKVSPNAIQFRKREHSGEVNTLDSLHYSDGLGRKLAIVQEDESGFVVNEAVLFNQRGGIAYKFLPYKSGSGAYQAPTLTLGHSKQHYDPMNRLVETINPETVNGQTSITIDYRPLETRTINEKNQLKTVLKDGLDRVIEVQENNQGATYHTRYQYDVLGNLTQVTDAHGNIKQMQYDGLGRKTWMNDPDMGIKTYQYDANGNLIRTEDAKNQVIEFSYDGINRLLVENYLEPTNDTPEIQYTYDEPGVDYPTTSFLKGRLSYVQDQSGASFFSYDVHGRVVWHQKRIAHRGQTRNYLQQAEYDSLGRVTRDIAPNGKEVSYQYNKRGLLQAIPGFVDKVTYSASGQFASFQTANEVHSSYTYDARNRLKSLISTNNQGATIQDLAYTFDEVSNITAISDLRTLAVDAKNNASQSFLYDDLNRLTQAKGPGYGTIDFQYDAIGNMIHKISPAQGDPEHIDDTLINLGTMSYGGALGTSNRIGRNPGEAPGPHAITATEAGGESGGLSYQYDDTGNMTRHAEGDVYEWNYKNRLIRSVTAEHDTSYVYDYRGQRVIKSNTHNDDIETVYYVSKQYEVREGKILRYVFAGDRRVARVEQKIRDFDEAQAKQRLALKQGWNMVSLTVEPADASIGTLLGDKATKVVEIVRYDVSNDTYQTHEPNGATKEFTTLESGTGYLINATEDLTLEFTGTWAVGSAEIKEGWNLVAGNVDQQLPITEALTDILADSQSIWSYDNITNTWQRFLVRLDTPNFLTTLETIKPGNAYWVKASETTSLPRLHTYNEETIFYHPDHLGSTSLTTDQTGAVISETAYYPFGRPRYQQGTSANSVKYLHTGHELDSESTIIYSNARYRDPVIGRFISVDPLLVDQPEKCGIQECNLYSYTTNNPIIYFDPLGLNEHRYDLIGAIDQFFEDSATNLEQAQQNAYQSGNHVGSAIHGLSSDIYRLLEFLTPNNTAILGEMYTGGMAFNEAAAVYNSAKGANSVLWKQLNKSFVLESKIWNPINGPGPLGEEIAKTFRSATYTETVLSEPLTLYRVYGGKAGSLSPYWSKTPPSGPLQSQLDSALLSEWGNSAQHVSKIMVPKGTRIFEGYVAPQVGKTKPFESLMGGGSQVFIPRVNPNWVVK